MQENRILNVLPRSVRILIHKEQLQYEHLQEIKLRVEKPLLLIYRGEELILGGQRGKPYMVTKEDVREMLEYISNYSLYAYEQEMKQGFITIEGGHRVGMTGQAIIENGKVKNLKHISSVNVRMSHEVLGCADKVFPYITYNRSLYHTLVISPPRCGKTTLLRDMIRQISDGNAYVKGCTVGVVDERSELGGCYLGIAQNDIGMRTDILDCCPKAEGMILLIRSMAPRVLAIDEIGGEEEIRALEYAMHCGCKLIASVHGSDLEEISERPGVKELIEQRRFERYIVLDHEGKPGTVRGIYDERGIRLCGK